LAAKGGKKGDAFMQQMQQKKQEELEAERNTIRGRRGKAAAFIDNQIRQVMEGDMGKKEITDFCYSFDLDYWNDQVSRWQHLVWRALCRGIIISPFCF
jgi:hypothetical protein